MNFIRIFYGKFLDQIDNEIPVNDIILNQTGSFKRSLEPGEPNFPAQQNFSFTLRNVNYAGEFLYPFEFWAENSRLQSEGATQDLQIYFRIETNGITNFKGILRSLKYGDRDATCTILLGDMMDLVRQDTRKMLRSFKFEGLQPLVIDTISIGINDLPTLRDLHGTTLDHECMRFKIGISAGFPSYKGSEEPYEERSRFLRTSYSDHIGIQFNRTWPPNASIEGAYDVAEIERNAFVQIGQITLFTRIRLTLVLNISLGPFYYEELFLDVWHSAEPIASILPRGRFFYNDKEVITTDSSGMEIIIHEPSFGYDQNTAVYDAFLPMYQNYIFGLSYDNVGSEIQLSTRSYSWFDLVDAIQGIINSNITVLHTTQSLHASITITSGATSSTSGTKASGSISLALAPSENEYVYVRFSKIGGPKVYLSEIASLLSTMTNEEALDELRDAINNGFSGNYFTAARTGSDLDLEFDVEGLSGNDWFFEVLKTDVPTYYSDPVAFPISISPTYTRPTSGGASGDFVQTPIDIYFGSSIFASTDDILEDEEPESVLDKVYEALVDVNDSDYEFSISGNSVDLLYKGSKVQNVRLDVKETGVAYEYEDIIGTYNVFEEKLLPDIYRKVFVADLIMYGWAINNLAQSLVSMAWQLSGYLYTNKDGNIVVQSRDYLDINPDMIEIYNEDIEVIGGSEFEEGFRSYSTDIPTDIIEVNNVVSPERVSIIADRNGLRDNPTLKNKPIRLGNFRIKDLGVPEFGNPFSEKVLRLSPKDPGFPGNLDEFLPEPQTQLKNIAKNIYFPKITRRYTLYYPDYEDIDVGSYLIDLDNNVWLVKDVLVIPNSQMLEIVISFQLNQEPIT